MMRLHSRAIALAAACIMLAGCGGAAGSGGPAVPGKSASSAAATFVVKIPAKASVSTSSRRPAYITSNVAGIDFTAVSTANATLSTYVFYALSASSPNCTGTVSTGLTCTLAVSAPPGSDVFTVNLYDAVEPGQAFILSTGTVTQTIASQKANTINITTNGVATFATIGAGNPYPASGAAAVIPLALQIVDPDGNIIVGSFDMPVTLSDSDTSGATSLSSTSIAQTSDATGLALNYTGLGTTPAKITVTGTSPALASRANTQFATVTVAPGGTGPSVSPSALYFAHANSAAQTMTVTGQNGSTGTFTVDSGCTPYVTVTGTSPTFTITPAQSTFSSTAPDYNTAGTCTMTVTDSTAHATKVGVIVSQ